MIDSAPYLMQDANLLRNAAIRLSAMSLGISRIEARDKGGFIEFGEKNNVDLDLFNRFIARATERLPFRWPYQIEIYDKPNRSRKNDSLYRRYAHRF